MNEKTISVLCHVWQGASKNSIRKAGFFVIAAMFMFGWQQNVSAQYNTPVSDGFINPNEYGLQTNGQNQQTSGAVTWLMTWDNTNLYVAVVGADTKQGAVLYLNVNPSTMVKNSSGQSYDGTDFDVLPFPSDFVVYFKDGYNEYRNDIFFSNQIAQTLTYGSLNNNTREITIPWNVITGTGRPANFRHAEYVTTPDGFVYGQLPTTNAGGNIGANATWTNYYNVCSTLNNTTAKPYVTMNGTCASATTAAGATLQGRVVANGRGISKARVSVTGGANSLVREVQTNALGYFTFTNLPTGDYYIVNVRDKRYNFDNDSQVVELREDGEIIFTGSRR